MRRIAELASVLTNGPVYNTYMLLVVFIAGILAAAGNAGSSVLQRAAAGQPKVDELFSGKFALAVTRHPLFLLGLGLQIAAAILQAVALSQGPLAIVQPLLTIDLVFLLIFLNLKNHLHPGIREWSSVAAIVSALGALFLIARPRGGTAQYALLPWAIAISASAVIILGCMAAARRMASPRVRVGFIAAATSVAYALNAGFTKLALHQFQTAGLGMVLTSWPVYALIISGIVSLYLIQNTYGAGPLAVSQPVTETIVPVLSVTIGIAIFGETIRHTPLAFGAEIFCAVILLTGIALLGSSKKISPGYSERKT